MLGSVTQRGPRPDTVADQLRRLTRTPAISTARDRAPIDALPSGMRPIVRRQERARLAAHTALGLGKEMSSPTPRPARDVIRWGIIGCGDVCEVKSGPAFQKATGSSLVAVMRRDAAKKAREKARREKAKALKAAAAKKAAKAAKAAAAAA
jgi:hypothetical protein